jgi:hypothetical protein
MDKMKLFIFLTVVLILAGAEARGAYFPDPVPTENYDVIYGDVLLSLIAVGEVAAWDTSGVLRFRTDITDNSFGMAWFYQPTGSPDPHDFIWQIFDGATLWSATIADTNWLAWQGNQETFWVNLNRDQPVQVIPEPATLLILGLLGGSGSLAGLIKKRWQNNSNNGTRPSERS